LLQSDSASRSLYDGLARLVRVIALRVKKRCPASIEVKDLEQIGHAALWAACVAFDPARRVTFPTYARMRICGSMLDFVREQFREARREAGAVRIDEAGSYLALAHPKPVSSSYPTDPFVSRAVDRLGGRQAAVIGLRFYAGLTRVEAGRRLGISPKAVTRSERAAVLTLRTLLRPAACWQSQSGSAVRSDSSGRGVFQQRPARPTSLSASSRARPLE